ncbi:MAG: hypothetical protein ACJA2R_000791 [Saprospiraceae bacterium]|jgi:hypothetical protein
MLNTLDFRSIENEIFTWSVLALSELTGVLKGPTFLRVSHQFCGITSHDNSKAGNARGLPWIVDSSHHSPAIHFFNFSSLP